MEKGDESVRPLQPQDEVSSSDARVDAVLIIVVNRLSMEIVFAKVRKSNIMSKRSPDCLQGACVAGARRRTICAKECAIKEVVRNVVFFCVVVVVSLWRRKECGGATQKLLEMDPELSCCGRRCGYERRKELNVNSCGEVPLRLLDSGASAILVST